MFKNLSIHSTAAIGAVLLAGSVYAQTGSTTVQSSGLACTTRAGSGTFNAISWSVGASEPVSTNPGGGGPAGRPQVGAFNLVKAFDECSPALFQALATGRILQAVTITDRGDPNPISGAAPKPAPVSIQLSNVLVSQFVLSDGGSAAGPGESISLVYQKITITNLNNGSKFCWDVARNASC